MTCTISKVRIGMMMCVAVSYVMAHPLALVTRVGSRAALVSGVRNRLVSGALGCLRNLSTDRLVYAETKRPFVEFSSNASQKIEVSIGLDEHDPCDNEHGVKPFEIFNMNNASVNRQWHDAICCCLAAANTDRISYHQTITVKISDKVIDFVDSLLRDNYMKEHYLAAEAFLNNESLVPFKILQMNLNSSNINDFGVSIIANKEHVSMLPFMTTGDNNIDQYLLDMLCGCMHDYQSRSSLSDETTITHLRGFLINRYVTAKK